MSETASVWKFPLEADGSLHAELPAGAVIVHAGLDPNGQLCVWAQVNTSPNRPKERRYFDVVATGGAVYEGSEHVRSFVNEPFVWHVYETTRAMVAG